MEDICKVARESLDKLNRSNKTLNASVKALNETLASFGDKTVKVENNIKVIHHFK